MTHTISAEKQERISKQIIDMRDCEKSSRFIMTTGTGECGLAQGQFVFALHPFSKPILCVGYVLQVRKGVGVSGTDIVLLRLANTSIQQWENQGFYTMSAEQEKLARSVFEHLPEQEDDSHGYTSCERIHKVGFLIEEGH